MRRAAAALLFGLGAVVLAAPGPPDPTTLLTVDGTLAASPETGKGMLTVHAKLAQGWHTNSHKPSEDYLIPTSLKLTPEGRLVFLMQGFKTAPEVYRHVHADLDHYRQFVKKIDAQDIATLSAEEAYATGRELYGRSDPAAALPRLKRASVAPKPQPGVRENALEGLAEVELELGDTQASREAIEKLAATTKDPAQKERADLFRAQLPLAEKKPAEALALYKKFLKDHPSSPYRAQVEGYIARLEGVATAP